MIFNKILYLIIFLNRLFISYIFILQVEEATVRAAGADKDHRKELDAMLSSLGVAPVSGK